MKPLDAESVAKMDQANAGFAEAAADLTAIAKGYLFSYGEAAAAMLSQWLRRTGHYEPDTAVALLCHFAVEAAKRGGE